MLNELNPEWLNDILLNMEDAVCLTGKSGELLYANPAAQNLFSLDVTLSPKIWDAIPYVEGNDALIQLFIDGVTQKRESFSAPVDYVNNEGEVFRLYVTLTCKPSKSGTILIVIHNLTRLIKVYSAFERYTSPEIADYVLSTPEGEKQGGRVREVSILMSDLRGFTAMSTHLSPDRLITMLNHYFEAMAAVIRKYRGTVIEFLGDGIFVVFGAPKDMPDHATAAACCAVEMQNAMAGVNAWNRENGYPELEMGIGVNSGPAVVGNIGSDQKMKYGCMGETVNLTGRLESFSLGGEICLSERTRNLIPADVKTLGENAFMPKGGREEIRYFTIAGVGEDCVLKNAAGTIRWRRLPEAKETVFLLLEGKSVEPKEYAGCLTEVSEDERYGMLATDTVLNPLQNILLRFGGTEVYAKVTRKAERGIQIGFTMKPEEFSALIG